MHATTILVPVVISRTSEGQAQPTLYLVPARIPATSIRSGYSMWNIPFLGLGTVLPHHFLQRETTPDGPVLPQRTPLQQRLQGPYFFSPCEVRTLQALYCWDIGCVSVQSTPRTSFYLFISLLF